MQGLITVFGGSAFLDRYVVRALARQGWRLKVAAPKPNAVPELRVMGDVGQIELTYCDVRNPDSVARALQGAVGVVDLSGQAATAGAVARAAAALGVARYVRLSSLGADARSPSAYGRAQAQADADVLEAAPFAAVLRPSILFGPEDVFFNGLASLATISPILPVFGGAQPNLQPVYAGDVGDAVAAVFDAPERLGGRVHRLCGPASYSFKTLAQLVLRETGRSRLLAPLPPAAAAFLAKFGDVQAAVLPLAPILTSDQLAQLDGAGDEGADLRALGVTPTPLEAVLPSYLWRFRKGGQFAELVSAAE